MKRRIFPEALKQEEVERAVKNGLAVGKIVGELGLVDSVLRRWMRELGAKASAQPPRLRAPALALLPADLASENARFRQENDRLRMERKILKKSSPFLGGLEVNGKNFPAYARCLCWAYTRANAAVSKCWPGRFPRRQFPYPGQRSRRLFHFVHCIFMKKAIYKFTKGDHVFLLFGPPGDGKTHLCAVPGLALVENGWRVLFTRTTDLVQRLGSGVI